MSSSSSTLICALSGQPVSGVDAVVTPSGRICVKKLLLSKMADNGGSDPFSNQPLDVDQLVSLNATAAAVVPPRPSATSMSSLLSLVNSEYSNLVLELFDTRQLLEDTRKELSQALYQNDAAVRVVARLAMERDAARQELTTWKASSSSTTETATTAVAEVADDGPAKKRARPEEEGEPKNDSMIPAADLDVMTQTWQTLSQKRKAIKKDVAAQAPAVKDLQSYAESDKKSYHKTKGKQGILDMTTTDIGEVGGELIVTVGKDKQVCVYKGEQVVHTYAFAADLVDASSDLVAAATKDTVKVFKGDEEVTKISIDKEQGTVVALSLHPSQKHIVVATQNRIMLYSVAHGEKLAVFESEDEIACGTLHPDGLIYAVGTTAGKISLWDFKSQKLAASMGGGDDALAMANIVFSTNGYHVATVGADGKANIWDLKKQVSLVELSSIGDAAVPAVTAVTFDPSGKYVAYGGDKSLVLTAVKEWTVICKVEQTKQVSHLSWTKQLVSASVKERTVRFYGTE